MFKGCTFENQNVTSKNDGGLYQNIFSEDGILWGCTMSISNNALTIQPGELMTGGRLISVDGATQIACNNPIADGYGQVILTIDLSKTAATDTFTQVETSVIYSATTTFPALIQGDINGSGGDMIYQQELAVIQIAGGNISGIMRQIGNAVIDAEKFGGNTAEEFANTISEMIVPSNPNLLINGWLKYAVNRRGNTTFTQANEYMIDRWMLISGSAAYSEGTGLTLANAKITQYVEGLNELVGSEFTLSAKFNGQIISVSGTLHAQGQITDNGLTIAHTSSGYIAASIYGSGVLEWVKLELGNKATQYSPNTYASELAQCIRYYQELDIRQTAYVFGARAYYRIHFSEMRAIPIVTGTIEVMDMRGGNLLLTTTPQGGASKNSYEFFYDEPLETYVSCHKLMLDAEIYE